MKRIPKIIRATACIYLFAATAYSLLFIFYPWPEMMNFWWRIGFGLVGVTLFLFTFATLFVAMISKQYTRSQSHSFLWITIYGVLLATWMFIGGPYSRISLSTVKIVNASSAMIDRVIVTCPGDTRTTGALAPGKGQRIAVLPLNEGVLKADFYSRTQIIATAETFILECAGDRFPCVLKPDNTAEFIGK
jgi:hypothetical protein